MGVQPAYTPIYGGHVMLISTFVLIRSDLTRHDIMYPPYMGVRTGNTPIYGGLIRHNVCLYVNCVRGLTILPNLGSHSLNLAGLQGGAGADPKSSAKSGQLARFLQQTALLAGVKARG